MRQYKPQVARQLRVEKYWSKMFLQPVVSHFTFGSPNNTALQGSVFQPGLRVIGGSANCLPGTLKKL